MHLNYFSFCQYLTYFLKAVDKYSLHSPFVYQFYTEVLSDKRKFYAFEEIESVRADVLKDSRSVEVLDLGKGSVADKGNYRKIAKIAQYSLSKATFSRLLFKMILFYKPRHILELGTSLGINTLYLAKADSRIPVTTMEGCPQISHLARENFRKLNASNILLIEGDIDHNLPTVMEEVDQLGLVYFDANHTREATLRYFECCLQKADEDSIFIFDDIHLSKEMYEAWKEICGNSKITISIDVFDAGILFFNPGLKREHYILEF